MPNNKVLHLFSGGIDSTVLLFWLLDNKFDVHILHVNYGQKSFSGEQRAINDILPDDLKDKFFLLDVPNIRDIGRGSLVGEYPQKIYSKNDWFKSEFFPNRNMILISLAAAYCYKINCNIISIGIAGQNSYKDTTSKFVSSIETSINNSLDDHEIKIVAPFADMLRENVIYEALRLGIPIEKTFSCNALEDRHCMYCTSCIEREQAINVIKGMENSRIKKA